MVPSLSFGSYGSIDQYGMPLMTSPGTLSMGMAVPAPPPVPVPTPAAVSTPAVAVNPTNPAGAGADAAAASSLSAGDWLKGLIMQDGKVNLDGIKDLFGIASSLGNLWGGFQANSLAKDALNFQKKSYRTNLNNQISSYNTALSDRAYARASQEGRSASDAQQYINQNRLEA